MKTDFSLWTDKYSFPFLNLAQSSFSHTPQEVQFLLQAESLFQFPGVTGMSVWTNRMVHASLSQMCSSLRKPLILQDPFLWNLQLYTKTFPIYTLNCCSITFCGIYYAVLLVSKSKWYIITCKTASRSCTILFCFELSDKTSKINTNMLLIEKES